jgi:hypothetical protein
MKIAFLILFTLSALASDQWYGSIKFKKTFQQETIEEYQSDSPFFPGSNRTYEKKTWSGSIRFLPGDRSQTSATYYSKSGMDRKTRKMIKCQSGNEAEYRDYHLLDSTSNVSINSEVSEKFTMYIVDGKYDGFAIARGGKHQKDVIKETNIREWYNGCKENPLKVEDQSGMDSGTMQSLTFKFKGIAANDAQVVSGSWAGKDEDGGDLEYEWSFTRKEPNLISKITGPSSIERASNITLDGSSSVGRVDEYKWDFNFDDDCISSAEGAQVILKGPKVTFMALCNFTAQLNVKNDEGDNSAEFKVMVTPRKGDKWRTKFSSVPSTKPISLPMATGMMHFGANHCAEHESTDADSLFGHIIHNETDSNETWENVGYEIEQVSDGGPFTGAWYIKAQKLKVKRLETVNAKLMPGGNVYLLNKEMGNVANIDLLTNQIKAHEAIHGKLLKEKLDSLGEEGDPATLIERLVGFTDEALQTTADMNIREVEGVLKEATFDEHVKPRLSSQGFSKEVSIWIPDGNGGSVLRSLGPLWNIGD